MEYFTVTASITHLPRYHGPKPRPKRGRPPKNTPRATIHYLWQAREAKRVDREAREKESANNGPEAYRLYCGASRLDESTYS